MNYEARGYHVVADILNVQKSELLISEQALKPYLEEAAKKAGGTVVGFESYSFDDGSFSAVLILAESHLSVHTNPKENSLAFDVFMCGHNARPKAALMYLCEVLQGTAHKVTELVRDAQYGMGGPFDSTLFSKGADSHIIVELVSVSEENARNMSLSVPMLLNAVNNQGIRVTSMHFKSFGEQYGYSGALLLDKGHLTVHTWPESGFISLDFYIQNTKFNNTEVLNIINTLTFDLGCGYSDLLVLNRGV